MIPLGNGAAMVTYGAACEDCSFTFENGCDATTHTVAERHARAQGHEVVYGSWTLWTSPSGAVRRLLRETPGSEPTSEVER